MSLVYHQMIHRLQRFTAPIELNDLRGNMAVVANMHNNQYKVPPRLSSYKARLSRSRKARRDRKALAQTVRKIRIQMIKGRPLRLCLLICL